MKQVFEDNNAPKISTQILDMDATFTDSTDNKNNNPQKKDSTPHSDLAISGAFIVVGIFLNRFPIDATIPTWNGFFQFLSYSCYIIGFLGAAFGLAKVSKKDFFTNIGMGIVCCLIAYWIHEAADSLRSTQAIISILLRVAFLIMIFAGVYGLLMGIPQLFITTKSATQQNHEPEKTETAISEKPKIELIAGIFITILAVITALLQALPAILTMLRIWLKFN